MKVVILAGGMGTRMREETEFKPKPMVEVGGIPILKHIMNHYMKFSYRDFVVCLGYKGGMIRRYFFEYPLMTNDLTLSNVGAMTYHANPLRMEDHFDVTLCDTGLKANTAERIWKARRYLGGSTFLCTYGDGLSDVNIQDVVNFHNKHGKLATLVAVQPKSRYGVLDFRDSNTVRSFQEKPTSNEWINAGFFVFNAKVAEYCGDACTPSLEGILRALAEEDQLVAYRHHGFFASCDTSKDLTELNELWDKGDAPWTR